MEKKTIWKIDKAHSTIPFKVKHLMISTVTGHFDDFDSTIESDGDNFTNAKIEFNAKTDSINTNNDLRDKHLKSDDFFNSEKYPEMKFVSKSFDGKTLVGNLTIRDVTKEITLNVVSNGIAIDPYGQTKVGFEVTGEINRKEFNLLWDAVTEAGNIMVSDQVKLEMDVQYIKQA